MQGSASPDDAQSRLVAHRLFGALLNIPTEIDSAVAMETAFDQRQRVHDLFPARGILREGLCDCRCLPHRTSIPPSLHCHRPMEGRVPDECRGAGGKLEKGADRKWQRGDNGVNWRTDRHRTLRLP